MAVVPGGAKLCTRKNFNSNVVSYFTNDDKILTRRDLGISFTVGNYNYTVYSSVKDLNTCMRCEDITYTKTSTLKTYSINFAEARCEPNFVSRYAYEWEQDSENGGVCMYDNIKIIAYSDGGSRLYEEKLTVKIYGEEQADQVEIMGAQINGGSDILFSSSETCSYLEMTNTNYQPIGGISYGRYLYLNGSTNKTWSDICFEII
jgi:hypothetical protein